MCVILHGLIGLGLEGCYGWIRGAPDGLVAELGNAFLEWWFCSGGLALGLRLCGLDSAEWIAVCRSECTGMEGGNAFRVTWDDYKKGGWLRGLERESCKPQVDKSDKSAFL